MPREAENQGSMPFLGHVRELRVRLIRISIVLAVFTLIALAFTERFLKLLLAPYGTQLQLIGPTEGVSIYLRVALAAGAAAAMPYMLLEAWGFVKPALRKREKGAAFLLVPVAALLFLAGAAFSWFVLVPAAVRFLSGFSPAVFRVEWTADRYIPFVVSLVFWIGVSFELPLVVYFLSRLRILTARALVKGWRYAIVLMVVAAAVITPTVDPFNMMLVTIPLVALYVVSILAAGLAGGKRNGPDGGPEAGEKGHAPRHRTGTEPKGA